MGSQGQMKLQASEQRGRRTIRNGLGLVWLTLRMDTPMASKLLAQGCTNMPEYVNRVDVRQKAHCSVPAWVTYWVTHAIEPANLSQAIATCHCQMSSLCGTLTHLVAPGL